MEFVQAFRLKNRPMSVAACRANIRDSFAELYWRYTGSTKDYGELPWYAALRERATDTARWLRNTRRRQHAFSEDGDNPLRFDPGRDRGWWYPAP